MAFIWAVWMIVPSFLIIGLSPWFAAAMIALASLVMYGLASRPDWSEATAWDNFTQAMQSVPSDASANDAQQALSQAGQELEWVLQQRH